MWVLECAACGLIEEHDSWYGAMQAMLEHCWNEHRKVAVEERNSLGIAIRAKDSPEG